MKKIKKICCLCFLAGTGILVSYRGGNISYLLFYSALALPLTALAYSLYVYLRFKIVQEVSHVVIKGQKVPYHLLLANEDPIPFTDISLHFYTDRVTMKEDMEAGHLCLLPRSQTGVDTRMHCRYRGTYPVGVKSVTVTDFFGLFSITYPMRSQVRLTAKPRLIPLEDLMLNLQEKDPKADLLSLSHVQDLPDYDLRRYQSGDSRKRIHWKNSAKAGELLVRRQMPEELFETVVLLDLSPIDAPEEERLTMEDNVIETALSFIHDSFQRRVPVRAVFMQEELCYTSFDTSADFDAFYTRCADLSFTAAYPLEKVWLEYQAHSTGSHACILVTARGTQALRNALREENLAGKEAVLIEAGGLSL